MKLCFVLAAIFAVETVAVGHVPGGYTFAMEDEAGHILAATAAVGSLEASILIFDPETPDEILNNVTIVKSKGHVTSGCIAIVNDTSYFYGGLSEIGSVIRLDLSFPPPPAVAVKYLNATDTLLLWDSSNPQQIISTVCHGRYVFFGTRAAPSASSTILRLDTLDPSPTTRFRSVGLVGAGDMSTGSSWGEDYVLFAMEPAGNVPLSFYVVTANTSLPQVVATMTAPPTLTSFTLLSGMAADPLTRRVVIANANGNGRLAVLDLSANNTALLEQELSLNDVPVPITSFVVDVAARYAYVTAGDCDGDADVAFVAVRLVPSLTQDNTATLGAQFNCSRDGVPMTSLLLATASSRAVLVFTLGEYQPGHPLPDGSIQRLSVVSAKPCPDDCNEATGNGECAGGQCYCSIAFTGESCAVAVPCGGTGCHGHGRCSSGGCECDKGWEGLYCDEMKECPTECNGRGSCSLGECTCVEGFAGEACQYRTVGCDALDHCTGAGVCVPGYPAGSCQCFAGYTGPDCSLIVAACVHNCSGNGLCSQGMCMCNEGWTGPACTEKVVACRNNCSGLGVCHHGRCTCFRGFKGIDCSVPDTLACDPVCSPHGSCVNATCVCAPTFTGPDCAGRLASSMSAVASLTLDDGQNVAVAVALTGPDTLTVCTAQRPGQCASLSIANGLKLLSSTVFEKAVELATSAVALVEVDADDSMIGVAVQDASKAFMLLGTHVNGTGLMHGEIFKVSTDGLALAASLSLSDDVGRGVSAICDGPNGHFIVTSGSMLYLVDANLTIVSRRAGPPGEVGVLLYDPVSGQLLAVVKNFVSAYLVVGSDLETLGATPAVKIPDSAGSVVTGFVAPLGNETAAYLATSSSPASLVRILLAENGPTLDGILVLGSNENRVTAAVASPTHEAAYLALGADGAGSCLLIKVSLAHLTAVDAVALDCSADLVAAAVSADGVMGYLASADSPAKVIAVKFTDKEVAEGCEADCSGHGACVKNTCVCRGGWHGPICSFAPPCPRNCSHAGLCVGGVCQCAVGRTGPDCSEREICRAVCIHGHCSGQNRTQWPCVCESTKWGGERCDEPRIGCQDDCSGNGFCDKGVCICFEGYDGVNCASVNDSTACSDDAECGTGLACDNGVCRSADQQPLSHGISPALIAVAVVGAALLAIVGAVAVWKAWGGQLSQLGEKWAPSSLFSAQSDELESGKSRLVVGDGNGYSRIPRRLVK